MILSSPTRNILSRIFYEKTQFRSDMEAEREILKKDRCLLFRDPKVLQLLKSDLYLCGERTGGNLLMSSSFLFEGMFKKLWVNKRAIFEYNLVSESDELLVCCLLISVLSLSVLGDLL